MMKRRRTLLTTILLMLIALVVNVQTICSEEIPEDSYEEDCAFCDGHELTMKEKYEELIVKALIDEKNLLDDGIITKEVYSLQCEPFEKALDDLESATDEEILEGYKSILIYFFDQLSEYEADGEEIDKGFEEYIMGEIKSLELEEELGL